MWYRWDDGNQSLDDNQGWDDNQDSDDTPDYNRRDSDYTLQLRDGTAAEGSSPVGGTRSDFPPLYSVESVDEEPVVRLQRAHMAV